MPEEIKPCTPGKHTNSPVYLKDGTVICSCMYKPGEANLNPSQARKKKRDKSKKSKLSKLPKESVLAPSFEPKTSSGASISLVQTVNAKVFVPNSSN